MKIKFIGKHTFYDRNSDRRLLATIPDGTICDAKYCESHRNGEWKVDKGHATVYYDDPTDGKRKALHYCLHAHGHLCEIIEEE